MSETDETDVATGQYSSSNVDVINPCQVMELDSVENSHTMPSFDSSQHVTPASITQTVNDHKGSPNLTINSSSPLAPSIIIGNVHAAGALSSIFHNQELTIHASKAFASSASLNSDLVSSVIPIFLTSGNSSTMSPSMQYSNQTSHISVSSGGKSDQVITRANEVQMCNETQSNLNINVFDSAPPKLSLSSSDTIILTSETSGGDSLLKILKNEAPLGENDKKLSLLPNISERTVSLDSIPSLTLFRPNTADAESGVCTEESLREVAVLGSDKIPQWLTQLMKKNKLQTSSNNGNEYDLTRSKTVSIVPEVQVKDTSVDEDDNSTFIKGKSHGEVDVDCDETPVVKRKSLEHSDTVILTANESTPAKIPANVQGFDEVNVPFDKLNSGLSFNSISTLSADSGELVDEQSVHDSITSKQVSETQSSITDLLQGGISQILYPVKITSDPLRFGLVNINETNSHSLRRFTSGTGEQNLPQSLENGSLLMVCEDAVPNPRFAEAKETQTDLVLGTNTVYFKTLPGTSQCETGQLPATILTMTASTATTHSNSGQALQFAQPDLATSTIPATYIAPASTAISAQHNIEFIAGTAINSVSQETSSASPGTGIESSKSVSPFKCVACDERFSCKEELVSHRKSHKTFKCDLCNATFSRMGNYTRHRKIHNLHAEVMFI